MGAASVSFALDNGLRAYAAYARGFEDSGTAPSFAENAGEVLPASRPNNGTPACAGRWAPRPTWSHRCSGSNARIARSLPTAGSGSPAWCATKALSCRSFASARGAERRGGAAGAASPDDRRSGGRRRPRRRDRRILRYRRGHYEPERWRGFGLGVSVASNGAAEAKADNSVESEPVRRSISGCVTASACGTLRSACARPSRT